MNIKSNILRIQVIVCVGNKQFYSVALARACSCPCEIVLTVREPFHVRCVSVCELSSSPTNGGGDRQQVNYWLLFTERLLSDCPLSRLMEGVSPWLEKEKITKHRGERCDSQRSFTCSATPSSHYWSHL